MTVLFLIRGRSYVWSAGDAPDATTYVATGNASARELLGALGYAVDASLRGELLATELLERCHALSSDERTARLSARAALALSSLKRLAHAAAGETLIFEKS